MTKPTQIDLAAAQDAACEWLAAQGCGCCADWKKLEAAQIKLAEALGLGHYENYAGELCFLHPGENAPDD